MAVELLRCAGLRCAGLVAGATGAMLAGAVFLEFRLLLGSQNGIDLLALAFEQLRELRFVSLGQILAAFGHEFFDCRGVLFKDRLDFVLLILGEAELFGHHLQARGGIHVIAVARAAAGWGRGLRVFGEGEAWRGDQAGCGEGEYGE